MVMKKLLLVGLAIVIPLGGADAYTLKKSPKSLNQEKVCLTAEGWCYPTVAAGECRCIVGDHFVSGTVISAGTMRAGIPHISEANGLPDSGAAIESNKHVHRKPKSKSN
jgi:hypothetical protein